MAAATSSLPVPFSPTMRTLTSVGATLRIGVKQAPHGRRHGLQPADRVHLAAAGRGVLFVVRARELLDHLNEVFGCHRFLEESGGAGGERLDGSWHGGLARHDHDRTRRRVRLEPPQQAHTFDVRHD